MSQLPYQTTINETLIYMAARADAAGAHERAARLLKVAGEHPAATTPRPWLALAFALTALAVAVLCVRLGG